MTIGFDGSRAFVKNRTGTENYSFQLLKALAKIDQKNSYVIYLRPGNARPRSVGESDRSEVGKTKDNDSGQARMTTQAPSPLEGEGGGEGENFNWPPNFKFEMIDFPMLWTQAGLAIETFTDSLDVLFTPAHTIPLIRKPGLKTVMTVHDLGSEYLPGKHQLKQRLYLSFITNFQLKSATKLIAVSESTKKDLVKKVGVDSKNVEVIYEGVDTDRFKPAKDDVVRDIMKKFDIEKNNYFLFVGTIQPRKNLINLINAYDSFFGPFENVPELVLAGGKGWLSDEIYELPKKLGLEKRVKFIGRVTDEELTSLYTAAIAFVFPSLFEGFGLPILEAMACDCPVITSNLSSMPEVGGDAAIYIEDPNDFNSIALAMTQVLKRTDDEKLAKTDYDLSRSYQIDRYIRDMWVKKGRKQVKNFSWEKAAKETLALLEQL